MTQQWDHDSKDTEYIAPATTEDDSIVIGEIEHPAILDNKSLARFGGLPMLKGSQMRTRAGWFLLAYGLGGIGKTSLIRTLRDAKLVRTTPIAYIDLDHHADPLYDLPDDEIDFFPIASTPRAWSSVKSWFQAAGSAKEFPWATIVLDSLHESQDANLLSITQTQVTLPEYGRSQREILALLKLLRDFSMASGVNVIVMCGAEPETDEMAHIQRYGLALTPKLASRVRLVANNIAYLESQTTAPSYTRILHFEPALRYVTKVAASPNSFALTQANPSLGHIIDVVKGGANWSEFAAKHQVEARRPVAQARPQAQAQAKKEEDAED